MKKPDPYMTDDENPELSDEFIARMRPAAEVLGQDFIDRVMRPRGRPRQDVTKEQVTLRLDAAVLEHYRAQGPGWQTRINDTLAAVVKKAG